MKMTYEDLVAMGAPELPKGVCYCVEPHPIANGEEVYLWVGIVDNRHGKKANIVASVSESIEIWRLREPGVVIEEQPFSFARHPRIPINEYIVNKVKQVYRKWESDIYTRDNMHMLHAWEGDYAPA